MSHTKEVCYTHMPAQHPSLSYPWHAGLKCMEAPILFSQALWGKAPGNRQVSSNFSFNKSVQDNRKAQ